FQMRSAWVILSVSNCTLRCQVRSICVSRARNEILELGARGGPRKFDKSKDKWSIGAIAMLTIPAFAFGLGCWQVARLQWKLSLLKHLEKRLNDPAVDFPINDLDSLSSMEYRRVRIKGRFLHEREFLLSPRGRFDPGVKKDDSQGSLLSSNDISSHGAHVVTPFVLSGSNLTIMVNRGWVPRAQMDRETRLSSEEKGEVTIEAIVRKTEGRPQFVGANQPERGVWFYKDFNEMGKYAGTAPIYVESVYEMTRPGGPIAGQTNVKVRNEHLNYLLTWYSLSAVTLGMWYMRFMKK
ncbi:sft-1, partial [Pristionchus pacificus]